MGKIRNLKSDLIYSFTQPQCCRPEQDVPSTMHLISIQISALCYLNLSSGKLWDLIN